MTTLQLIRSHPARALRWAGFAAGWWALNLTNAVVGFAVGVVASLIVAWSFWKLESMLEQHRSLLRTCSDLARNCQELLALESLFLLDVAARKYYAHEIATSVASLSGDEKLRTVNREILRIQRQEIPCEAVDSLGIVLSSHVTVSPKTDEDRELVLAATEAKDAATRLVMGLQELDSFRQYYDAVDGRAARSTLEEFVDAVEDDEDKKWEEIRDARAATREALFDLLEKRNSYSASPSIRIPRPRWSLRT